MRVISGRSSKSKTGANFQGAPSFTDPHAIKSLIYEWNHDSSQYSFPQLPPHDLEILDETWRDGLQSPSVNDPNIEEKIELLRLMCALGIDAANIGFAAAAPGMYEDAIALAQVIRDEGLPIAPSMLARAIKQDIDPVIEISEKVGYKLNILLFVGSSPIRHFVENWELDTLLKRTQEAILYCRKHGLETTFFTEDSTRSHPDVLETLWTAAIEAGAVRIGIADTVGYANPQGASQIVRFARNIIAKTGKEIAIDWHGHNDRGLAIANSLAAYHAGANRVHACALGIGERVGNTNMEQLLVNLKLDGCSGYENRDLTKLRAYVNLVSQACQVVIPSDYPIVGANAFRTSTGIHAAAIVKAKNMGGDWLADRVYSAIPADEVGLGQVIEVGPQSGRSNVQYWLMNHGFSEHANNEQIVNYVLDVVKHEDRVLYEHELYDLVNTLFTRTKSLDKYCVEL